MSAFTLVTKGNGLLLVLRKDPPFAQTWSLPGGHVEFGETLEAAAVREIREETGVRVRLQRMCGFENLVFTDANRRYHILLFRFVGVPAGGQLRTGHDVAKAAWIPKSDLPLLRLSPPARRFLEAERAMRVRRGR